MSGETIEASVLDFQVRGEQAIATFGQIENAAERMEMAAVRSAERTAEQVGGIGKNAGASSAAAEAASRRFVASLEQEANRLTMTRAEYRKWQAEGRGVAASVYEPLIAKIQQAEEAQRALSRTTQQTGSNLNLVGVSAGQAAQAMRQLPAQITDIVTSLASGQSVFTVAIQQGGQLKDSFGGIGNTLKALSSGALPAALGLGAVAGAIGAVGLAYKQGAEEHDAFLRAIVLSGNAAGTTTSALKELAKAQSQIGGTQGQAAAALAQLVASGNTSAAMFAKLTNAAVSFERSGSGAASEMIEKFIALGKAPLQTLLRLNEAENFLTRSVYDQVKALEARGRLQEAGAVAQGTYADASISRTTELVRGLGTLETAWRAITGTAKKAWDSMLDIGRETTPEEKIAELEQKLLANSRRTDREDSIGPNGPRQGADAQRAALMLQLKDLQNAAALSRLKAEEAGKAARDLGEELANLPEKLAMQAALASGAFAKLGEQTKGAIAEFDSMAKRGLLSPIEAIEAKGDAALALLRGQQREESALYNLAVQRGAKDSELAALAAKSAVTRIAVLNQERATNAEILDLIYARGKAARETYRSEQQEGQAAIDELNNRAAKAYAAVIDQALEYGRAIDESNEMSAREASLIGVTAQARSVILENLRLEIAERRQLDAIKRADNLSPAEREEASRIIREGTIRAKAGAEAKIIADEFAKTAEAVNSSLSNAVVDAFKDGENAGKNLRDSLVNMFESMVLRPTIAATLQPVSNAIAGYLTSGQATGGGGGANWLNSASSLYSAGKTGYGWLAGSSATAGAGTTAAFTSSATTAPMAEYAGTAAAGGSSASAAIPIVGWILAALMASNEAYRGGNTVNMLDSSDRDLGIGAFETHKYETLSKLGFSDKWAQILSGAPIAARLFGHKASSSGFGIGSVIGGDFVSDNRSPFQYGDNTLGTGRNTDLEGLSSDIIASLALSASHFGGKLQEGLRVGSFTDRDRDGQVAALLGYFGANNKLLAGTQTGTGAFGSGGPTSAGVKIEGADFEKWVAEQMPLLLVEGLKQSTLDARFTDYFNSVDLSSIDATKAAGKADELLQTATAVANLTQTFKPLGGVFEQFGTASVQAVADFAKVAGGIDQLQANSNAYFDALFSKAEKLDISTRGVGDALAKVGLTMPDLSKGADSAVAAWRQMLAAQDLNTSSGREAAAAMLAVSGAFNSVVDAAKEAASKLTGSVSEAIKRFGTPQERQGEAFGGIATSLQRDAGVTVGIGQLIGASIDDINAFARAFLGVSANSDAAKTAVVDAANALFDLKKEAADQRGSLDLELLRAQGRELQAVTNERQAEIDQLRNLETSLGVMAGTFTKLQTEIYAAADATKLMAGLQNIVPDFLSGKDLANYRASQVQSTLAGAGINVSIDQIVNATGKQIRELFEAVGPAGKQALVDVYDEVKLLQIDLTKEQQKALEDQLTGMKGLRDLAHQMRDFVSTLKFGDLSPLSAEAQLTEAKSLFQTTLSKALGGDTQAQGNLQGVAQALLSEAQGAFASGPAYTAIFQQVTGALEALGLQGDALDPQIKYLESLSDNSRDMLDALLSIDSTLKGVPQSIGDRTYVPGPTGSGSGGGGGGSYGGVVDITPMQGAEASKQTELLDQVNKRLGEVVARLDRIATTADANAAIDQSGLKATVERLDALHAPLKDAVDQARLTRAKALVMRN